MSEKGLIIKDSRQRQAFSAQYSPEQAQSININRQHHKSDQALYYQPTPPPETVVVHSVPEKTNDACCWGW
ncbi:hypothetical protein BDF20DRAFT_913266 [Mycotypha africana]|uniref:uncharacterized protein n=1 Tax=Mycotypha africana TaxID=64632 RepID=UPI0023008A04|nr:uncharacterized protein BDF20DRAFT_913266 [Mycotypha africana]KAI8979751.1 hypothetical protein BDF20DRAFT_913266 [Mycotypha africana]